MPSIALRTRKSSSYTSVHLVVSMIAGKACAGIVLNTVTSRSFLKRVLTCLGTMTLSGKLLMKTTFSPCNPSRSIVLLMMP